jgi:hypothetical protein
LSGEVQEHQEAPRARLRDVVHVYTRPSLLFSRVDDSGAYGWALALLMGLTFLIGWAEVQTGLIDRVVERKTEQSLADLEKAQQHLVDRVKLREQMEEVRKAGEFAKLMTRIGAIVVGPCFLLSSFLCVASLLYAVVALTGRKPEYHTLMGVCVYAGFIDLAAMALRLAMMLYYRTTLVDTSLAMLAPVGKPIWLVAIDPFRIWFWVLVCVGLTITQQLSRRTAIIACSLMCLVSMAARVAWAYAPTGGGML